MKRFSVWLTGQVLLVFLLLPADAAEAKTYYHVTVKAILDRANASDCEWAWVTLVEIPKSRAYPREAALARRYGGSLRGSVLAFVRADAWRSAHRHHSETRCRGQRSDMVVSWQESRGDRVYAQGGLNDPDDPNKISFGFTNRKIVDENGRWFDPRSRAYVVVGMPVPAGGEPVGMRGEVMLRAVNYTDPLKRYSKCGKQWTEQYVSALDHFHLFDSFYPGSDDIFGQKSVSPGSGTLYVYQIVRSTSREHPHWQRQEM
jgi:hypothetical protein